MTVATLNHMTVVVAMVTQAHRVLELTTAAFLPSSLPLLMYCLFPDHPSNMSPKSNFTFEKLAVCIDDSPTPGMPAAAKH